MKSKIEPDVVEFFRLWLPQALLNRGCSHELSLSRRVQRLKRYRAEQCQYRLAVCSTNAGRQYRETQACH